MDPSDPGHLIFLPRPELRTASVQDGLRKQAGTSKALKGDGRIRAPAALSDWGLETETGEDPISSGRAN
jgi:hypothetical protein